MILCDRFAFIHLHKSGGTFVNQLLLQCVPSARQVGYHLPYRELPAQFRSLPVVGTVRNPWDYYLSWYVFQSGQARPNALFRICSDDGALGFAGTVRNLAGLSSDSERLDQLHDALPEHFLGAGLNLTKNCLGGLRGRAIGFYSFLYERMYRGAEDLRIVPVEDLRRGIGATLQQFGVLNERAQLFLDQAPPMNVTRHGHRSDHFEAELRELIGKVDRPVIAKHNYSF